MSNSENSSSDVDYSNDSLIEKKYKFSMLYDFYGELLKEHNRQIYEDYMFNDLSLSEIALERGISRQGVHDIIKRTNNHLQEYEAKLKLMKKYEDIISQASEAKNIISEINISKDISKLSDVEDILTSIINKI